MELYKVKLTKKQLMSIPELELKLLFLLANLLNDICILHKFAIFSNKEIDCITTRKAQNSQTFFILMLLAGKLWEGWQMLTKNFFGAKLSIEYEKSLMDEGKTSLQNIKKYFSGRNIIDDIRNKYTFHYGYSNDVVKRIDLLEDKDELDLFFSESHVNCFYYISTLLTSSSILNDINPDNSLAALEKFFDDITDSAKWFLNFCTDCLRIIATKYFDRDFERIVISDPPAIDSIFIPYFVSKS